jgi:tight adherence protein B
MGEPLIFGGLVALSILIGFVALWRMAGVRDPVDERLKQYGVGAELSADPAGTVAGTQVGGARLGFNRLFQGFGFGPGLASSLAQADIPLTAAEFSLIMLGMAVLGFGVGMARGGPVFGVVLGVLAGYMPILFVGRRKGQRKRAFTEQLPDVLTLLIGALRAGYGLAQALDTARERLPAPASTEFNRVMRAVGLGLPLQRALNEMADRVGSDELDLTVTAINVQYELGGNLAQTLETIADTIRDRIRIKREIRAFTAQQRLTGYLLALLPVGLAVALYMIRPEYISRLFQPGPMRLVLLAAVVMQISGFLIMRKIVDIEV